MVLNKTKAYKNLKKKGFIDSILKSGDHLYLEYYSAGKLILYTKVSHGSKRDIDIGLIRQMAEQCKLNIKDFANLCNCPLSKDEYYEKLKSQKLLDRTVPSNICDHCYAYIFDEKAKIKKK